ncbi:tyrosinase family protein [Kitasatospora sp. NPDC057692]|uniref:tyrosinase family protein n=1 Tax=Kitasatospora sp. NPDC057692 TaxID=3346215 RepID=UPI00367A02CC
MSQAERDRLIAAILQLDTAKFFGDGVSYWDKQEDIHKDAHLAGVNVHAGPGFVPWHRELVNRFEALIREVDPDLSLHYWDWSVDPRSTADGRANLFTSSFMGSASGDAGPPLADFESTEGGGHTHIWRQVNGGSPSLGTTTSVSDNAIVTASTWKVFNSLIQQAHSDAHGYIGGTLTQAHFSFHDPFVFLLHSNVDRLFAMWQTQAGHPDRLDPATVYQEDTGDPGLNGPVEPWAGNAAAPSLQLRPWAPPENQQVVKTYKDPSIVAPPCYDTVPQMRFLQVMNAGNEIVFNDVPTGETTARAAVFRLFACGPVTLRVTSAPGSPYTVLTPTRTVPHTLVPYTEVRVWFGMQGQAANSVAPTDGVTIHCEENGQDFPFTLKGNSIARPTVAVMLALDQSGSMDDPAGTGATRVQVLREAAGRFAQLVQEANGIGLIRFDTDAYPVNDPVFPGFPVTRIGPGGDFDPARVQALTAIGNHVTNINGATSIGDGVMMARDVLTAVPATDYQDKALIVFTDGLENRPASIDSVAGSIDQRTFAIGLGSETQVSTAALRKLANNTGGYLLLTGQLTPGTDDYFRLSKFFLQILAKVTNTAIVTDPSGYLAPGGKLRIPFTLTEADIDATVVVLDDLPVVEVVLETPDGDLIDAGSASAVGVQTGEGAQMRYYRYTLPVAIGAGAQAGTWNAVLTIDKRRWKDALGNLDEEARTRAEALGARYSVSAYAWSNLRMQAALHQSSIEPGGSAHVSAALTEYGLPVDHRAAVRAEVTGPTGTPATVLDETGPGLFEAAVPIPLPGTYHVRVVADGLTVRGAPFTREQVLTAVALPGGDRPPAGPEGDDHHLCELLLCLAEAGSGFLDSHGVDPQAVRRCLEAYCGGRTD